MYGVFIYQKYLYIIVLWRRHLPVHRRSLATRSSTATWVYKTTGGLSKVSVWAGWRGALLGLAPWAASLSISSAKRTRLARLLEELRAWLWVVLRPRWWVNEASVPWTRRNTPESQFNFLFGLYEYLTRGQASGNTGRCVRVTQTRLTQPRSFPRPSRAETATALGVFLYAL